MPVHQARGLVVPDDVAVIGFDDVEDSEFSTPPLTIIDSGVAWVASRAVELLLARCAGVSQDPVMQVADHALIIRSTA
ncbi:MAG TPA: substrate-binding domain-containing protein [Glycomyces sp.]|nr:substrate-binding domain-containing protein [Glycomyces sp.]